MEEVFHVPQQSRRNKLRFTVQSDAAVPSSLSPQLPPPPADAGGLHLSLSTHARPGGAYGAAPVGPFTGYASILGRSRFLRPAQELLEDFCSWGAGGGGGGVGFLQRDASKLLEDSGSVFPHDEEDDVSRRCYNPTLMSMLHEVYKRYKLYCQQLQSAVTSFESVAGLGNAAPYISLAIRAMFRHFHCLKNAILDHIHLTSRVFGGVDIRKGSTSGSQERSRSEPKQAIGASNLHHPVWRSQRGFPDKAVGVLRAWLFEHFLHPYPSDSDKQMLAQKTGLSRSQVSNWFTNARVRLWKPMVEEMHALERKAQCSKACVAQLNCTSAQAPLSQKDFQVYSQDAQYKRSRIEVSPRGELGREQFGSPLPGSQLMDFGRTQTAALVSHPPVLGSNQGGASGLSWSAPGQIVPFWLAKH